MAEPVKCAKCGRPFNRTFTACPFCGAPAGTLPPAGAAPSAGPVTCRQCARPFNPSFARCPFCNAPAAPAAAPAPATRLDYPAIADRTIATSGPLLSLDYHPASILALDAFFDITWGEAGVAPDDDAWRPNSGQRSAIIGFGALVGEIMRRAFGGVWEEDADYPDEPIRAKVALRGGVRALPINRAYKRLQNGAADEFGVFYRGIRHHVGQELSPPGLDGWQRQARHFEGVGRPDLAMRFYDAAMAVATAAEKMAMLGRMSETAIAAARLREREAQADPNGGPGKP